MHLQEGDPEREGLERWVRPRGSLSGGRGRSVHLQDLEMGGLERWVPPRGRQQGGKGGSWCTCRRGDPERGGLERWVPPRGSPSRRVGVMGAVHVPAGGETRR